jgi:hypothetical protein
LVAIWLTRRHDREKTLTEAALRAGEGIAEACARFIQKWEATPVNPPDQWYDVMRRGYVEFYLAAEVKSHAVRDSEFDDYFLSYHKFMEEVFKAWVAYVRAVVEASPGDGSEIVWSYHEGNLDRVEDLAKNASFEFVDVVNKWRRTLRFDLGSVSRQRMTLLDDVRAQIHGTVSRSG